MLIGAVGASLERLGMVILIGEKVLQGAEQKRAQPTLLAAGAAQGFLFEQMGKKCLGQVLCILRRMALSPDESVERRPVGAAELLQCLGRLR